MDETVDWLSDYFLRSRLSKMDLRSFGLYASWTPYIEDVVSFWDHLISCLINVQLNSCARESVGSSKIMKGSCRLLTYIYVKPLSLTSSFVHIGCNASLWKRNMALSQLCRTCTVRLWSYLSHGSFLWTLARAGKCLTSQTGTKICYQLARVKTDVSIELILDGAVI